MYFFLEAATLLLGLFPLVEEPFSADPVHPIARHYPATVFSPQVVFFQV